MSGYLKEGNQIQTSVIFPNSATTLYNYYKANANQYVPNLHVERGYLYGADSDHTSFNNNGYMGLYPFENANASSPYIHTTKDVIGISVNNFDQVQMFTQACLANVMSLAKLAEIEELEFTKSCEEIGDQIVSNTTGTSGYTHSNNNWDVTVNYEEANIEWELTGATISSGNTSLNGVTFNIGTTTVNWVATYGTNTIECSYNVTVENNDLPIDPVVINCPEGNFTRDNDEGKSYYTVKGNEFDVTATYESLTNNEIEDNDDVSDNDVSDNDVISDNDVETIVLTNNFNNSNTLANEQLPIGINEITWTATNGVSSAECTIIINIVDNEPPEIFCPEEDLVRYNEEGVNYYTIQGDEFDATATDNNLDNLLLINNINYTSTLAGEQLKIGNNHVIWTANDGNNYTQCKMIIKVIDNEPPIVNCIEEATRETDLGYPWYTIQGDELDITATDNNPDYLFIRNNFNNSTTLNGSRIRYGTQEIVWTISDGSNITKCTTIITIIDNEPPIFTKDCGSIGDQVVEIEGSETTYTKYGRDWDIEARDNVGLTAYQWVLSGATNNSGINTLDNVEFNIGTTNVKWIISDHDGNSTECEYNVTVISNDTPHEPPTIECPIDLTKTTDVGENYYTVKGNELDATATAYDDESLVLTNNFNNSNTLNGAKLPLGDTQILWTATDGTYTVECSNVITIVDKEAPTFIVDCNSIGDQIVEIEANDINYTHTGTSWDVTATDNDGIFKINWNLTGATSNSGETTLDNVSFNEGITTVNWIAIDNSGNTAECTFNVTVNIKDDGGNEPDPEPLEYCDSYAQSSYYEWISRFKMANIDNTSYGNGYSNFTDQVINVTKGDLVPIYFASGYKGKYPSAVCWSIWIDYNQDGIFSSNELVVRGWYYSGYTLKSKIEIPYDALNGETRLRISMKYRRYSGPCEIFQYGEVEDYTINIIDNNDPNNSDFVVLGNNNFTEDTEYFNIKNSEVPSIELYPNPAKEIITLNIFDLTNIAEINYQILDLSNRIVKTGKTSTREINVSDLKNGTYILYIDDVRPIIVKFIKE